MATYVSARDRGELRRLQKKFDTLVKVAREDGILSNDEDPSRLTIPDSLKTAFVKTADYLTRPNAAVAGAFDVALSTGKPGETMLQRVGRELSGKGDREFFGDVLEQQGLGDLKLSQVTEGLPAVQQFVTAGGRFDPGLRGTIGLALDVVLDPFTFVTAPMGGKAATVLMTRGGKAALREAGERILTQDTVKSMLGMAQKLGTRKVVGSLDDAVEAVIREGDGVLRLEQEIIQAARTDELMTVLKENPEILYAAGSGQVFDTVRLTQLAALEKSLSAAGAPAAQIKALTEGRKLRIFDSRVLFGQNAHPGIPILDVQKIQNVSGAAVGGVAKSVDTLMRKSGKASAAMDTIASGADAVDKFFNTLPRGARRIPLVKQAAALRAQIARGAPRAAEQRLLDLFGPEISSVLRKDKEFGLKFWRAADNEAPDIAVNEFLQAAAEKGIDGEMAVRRWQGFAKSMGIGEATADLIDTQRLFSEGRYMPLIWKTAPKEAELELVKGVFKTRSGRFSGADLDRFAEPRHFVNRSQAEEFVSSTGSKAELLDDVWLAMTERTAAHIGAMADASFTKNVIANYGTSIESIVQKVAAAQFAMPDFMDHVTKTIGRELTSEELDVALSIKGELVSGASHINDEKLLSKMDQRVSSSIVRDMFSEVTSLEQFNALWGRFGDIVRNMDQKFWDESRAGFMGGLRMDRHAFHEITVGPKHLRGRYIMPKGIADYLANFKGLWQQNPEVHQALRLWDAFQNFSKYSVTVPFPSFTFRNMYSNIAQSVLDLGITALNPEHHALGFRAAIADSQRASRWYRRLTGKDILDGTLRTANGDKIPLQSVVHQMRALDVLPTRAAITETTEGFLQTPATGLRKIVQDIGRVPQLIENEARAMHYFAGLAQGRTPAQAASKMKEFLFDYADLAPFEKNVMRRLFLFYTWPSKNVRLQLRTLVERPGVFTAEIKPFTQRGPSEDLYPEYLRGELSVRIEDDDRGNPRWLRNIDLPVTEIDRLSFWTPQWTLKKFINELNPMIKTPLEIGLNQDTFTGRSIKGHNFSRQFGPLVAKAPKPIREYLEFEEVKTRRGTSYKMNGLKTYLITKSFFMSRFLSQAASFERIMKESDGSVLEAMSNLMTGLAIDDLDLSSVQRERLERNIRRLDDELVRRGSKFRPNITARSKRPKKQAVFRP